MTTRYDQSAWRLLDNVLKQGGVGTHAKLRRALRVLAKYRAQIIADTLVARSGRAVRGGPFAGMTMPSQVAEGSYAARLLGCYEQELHPVFARIARTSYDAVIDIGCAEGYYAVGLARLLPNAVVQARDIDANARQLCREAVEANGVADRVIIGGEFTTAHFAGFADRRTLIVCDIEGAEIDLLDPARAPALTAMDLLVEMHDGRDAKISTTLIERFEASHDIEVIRPSGRDTGSIADLAALDELDQLLAVWEWRQSATPWAFMQARGKA